VELLSREIGPLGTNVYVLADARTREAIAIDTAIPCLAWISGLLTERGWTLKLIVSTHGHWDHVGDNAAVQAWTREQAAQAAPSAGHGVEGLAAGPGEADAASVDSSASGAGGAPIAVHPLDRDRLIHPAPLFAPFEIPPSVPAVDLAEGGRVRFGEIDLQVLHTPGHTEGSVCLLDPAAGLLLSGDTLFAGSWGRTDLPGGSQEQMAESLGRLGGLDAHIRVLPGHGPATTIGRERPWLEQVKASRRLPL
jgi:hydroxyacylglutathione hydrolase